MAVKLKSPFPYFGGKAAIAGQVWQRLGGVDNYIEPFCGSAAVLLARQQAQGVETVNDVNGYVTNFWRAIANDPEAVAGHCNYPVSELDLHARHRWLVMSPEAREFNERMRRDPEHFDAKIAGWWVWGACCWIGSGWCVSGRESSQIPDLTSGGCGDAATAMSEQLPKLSGFSSGCVPESSGTQPSFAGSEKIPRMTNDVALRAGPHLSEQVPLKRGTCSGTHGQGVNAAGSLQRPVMDTGRGGHPARSEGRPQLADAYDIGRGVHSNGANGACESRFQWLLEWFKRLQDRLRLVRICCGHWLRVCESDSVTTRLGCTGIFLDPPYPTHRADDGKQSRNDTLYVGDDKDALDKLRDEILGYCADRGNDKRYRIALACYEGDGYEPLESKGWQVLSWRAQGGYANRNKANTNKGRERLFFSPHCKNERSLFDTIEDNP